MAIRQAIPFFRVANIARSVAFYEALGFAIKNRWDPDGELRWCMLDRDGVSLMLQTLAAPAAGLGAGTSLTFMCDDALAIYAEARAAGLAPDEPFVGNGLWVTQFRDPDGYAIEFSSPTSVAEDTTLAEWKASSASA
ncbi:MAG: VOC family protein [Kofleriaceae bacterium]